MLAIGSGKGGVGKTWFAITLAHALAQRGRRVLLVDCDLGLANVDIQLGIMPATDIGALAEHGVPLDRVVIRHAAGFDVLAGRSGSGALASLRPGAVAAIFSSLQTARTSYDAVLLDLAAGLDPLIRHLGRFADELLLLVTDEPTSLTDGYAVLKLHAADAGSVTGVRIVVNQAPSQAAGERTFATLARACNTFLHEAPSFAGVVRADPRVRDAIRRQTPLLTRSPSSPGATDVQSVAAGLAFS
ncbi:MAG TPA: AAA family ATPase [Acetobacteraceae bacterium]|jgi:flagellar biosynthesis protein FlhG|nr:AAA family ATPase [Acetobacteraceae bacterium]